MSPTRSDGAADQARDRRSARGRARRPSTPRKLAASLGRLAASSGVGGGQPHADPPAQPVVRSAGLAADGPQAVEPAVPRHHLEEVRQTRPRLGPPRTRSRIARLLLVRDQREARMASSLGNCGRRLRSSRRRTPRAPSSVLPGLLSAPPRPRRHRRRRSARRRRRPRFGPRCGRLRR